MNKQESFVWDNIYHGALAKDANEKAARDHATMSTEDYRKSRFNPIGSKKKNCTITDLVEQRIQMAKRQK